MENRHRNISPQLLHRIKSCILNGSKVVAYLHNLSSHSKKKNTRFTSASKILKIMKGSQTFKHHYKYKFKQSQFQMR